MQFCEALGLGRGITSIIGSGGKSSLLDRLAEELRELGRVVLCTTTHMFPPPGLRTLQNASSQDVERALAEDGAVCLGELAPDGGCTRRPCPFRSSRASRTT